VFPKNHYRFYYTLLSATRIEAVTEVDCALWLREVARLLGRVHGLHLVRIGSYQASLGWAGDDLDVDVALAGEKQALADRELAFLR
jgi:hypothetical protein